MDVQGPGRQRPYISQHDPRNENIRMNTINNVYIAHRGKRVTAVSHNGRQPQQFSGG